MLLAREALLLRGGDDLAVLQQGGGTVVIEGGNAEDDHAARSEQCIDEGRHGAPLRQDYQHAEQDHHDDDRQQPVFLAGAHERPEFLDEGHIRFLELIVERVGSRPGRIALDPVAVGGGIETQAQGILAEEPHQQAGGGDDEEKKDAERKRADNVVQQHPEFRP